MNLQRELARLKEMVLLWGFSNMDLKHEVIRLNDLAYAPDGTAYRDMVWAEAEKRGLAEAAMTEAEQALASERSAIAEEARRYASHYPPGSDGRNTFVLLAEWIDARALTSGQSEAGKS